MNDTVQYHDKYFTREEISKRFEIFEGEKTFGEIDVKDVFHSQVPAKGIAGCVIEQSILDMKQNSLQEADLSILQSDGKYRDTELKVTGVQLSSRENQKYEAKEPMSITAVSIGNIEKETFLKSHFYEKIAHILLIFYYYDRTKIVNGKEITQKVVPYAEYDRFPVLGYKFLDIADDEEELARFENDWTLTQQFLIEAAKSDNPEELYPLLHSSIKDRLFYIDIAPRYKISPRQTPRFRFKKSYVNTIFQEYYNSKGKQSKKLLEKLPDDIASFEQLNEKLHELTITYKGMSVEELVKKFDIPIQYMSQVINLEEEPSRPIISSKQVTETIVVRMLGGKSKKISNIELFEKIGVIGKSVVVTQSGGRTEDTKFFTIDVDELSNPDIEFENSSFYQYFSEHKFLCVIFEEPSTEAPLNDNIFLGFKWFTFSDEFINTSIRDVYDIIRDRLINKTLIERYCYNSKTGEPIINKTGVPKVELNFPKSKEHKIFVRGTSTDSTYKPWTFEGQAADGSGLIHCYSQQIWTKGKFFVETLNNIDFI